ncbi:hypothetical protein [Flammeovirga sp. SJP92]|uniref:hypothetical protein n=1 Tax=Flammeovirga sp. SJP92 TaxID=1775430 RepID=UPI0007890456|nr:hypothetical protein [Flammeovirga sp. SJP92]KXX70114.1 hypothetical protein AVL50_14685 [Flammeovirga sp. SJP92]
MYRYLLVGLIAITLKSCIRFVDSGEGEVISEPWPLDNYEPVIMSREDFEKEIGVTEAVPLETTGKIYVHGKFLYVNEKNKGFHIYDNRYPNSPQKVKFLKALGATDIAIKGQYLYVNQATDLIAFYFNENQNTYVLTKRVKNVFPQKLSPEGWSHGVDENQIIVDWIEKTDY